MRTVDEICQSCADALLNAYLRELDYEPPIVFCDDCREEIPEEEDQIINGDVYCERCARKLEEF